MYVCLMSTLYRNYISYGLLAVTSERVRWGCSIDKLSTAQTQTIASGLTSEKTSLPDSSDISSRFGTCGVGCPLISAALRQVILDYFHSVHQEVTCMFARARNSVFCHGIRPDIEHNVVTVSRVTK